MNELSSEQWSIIDEHLFNTTRISAIKCFREFTGSSLKDAMDVIYSRDQYLRSQHPERFPLPKNAPEDIIERFRALPTPPLAVEAFWDGDTSGWFLVLTAIYEPVDPEHPEQSTHLLASLQDGGDIRLFNQQVPPWPEAEVARTVGRVIEQEYHIPFYFPSPHHPENECPRWWERHLGTPCQRCGILLLQEPEGHSWYGMCHHCSVTLERQQNTVNNET